jgi:hypothetical protein
MNRLKTGEIAVKLLIAATFVASFFVGNLNTLSAAESTADLAKGFTAPPDSARPHTWWHWMNGNITKEGITADLESMKRVGIGGAQIFNVLEGIPLGPVDYMSPEWLDMVKHAAVEADRLGLELCFHNCAGWSCSGGPWIKPEYAMQTVVTSETTAKGPTHFDAALPQPKKNHDYYRDIAVLAFPTPTDKTRIEQLNPKALLHNEFQYGIQPDSKEVPAGAVVSRKQVVDLTARLDKEGKLTWDVPEGDWTILRIGYTPTGAMNSPSTDSGRGLEVDKMSRDALDVHWVNGIEPVIKKLGPLVGKSFNNCLVDSYEMGDCNWTPKFREEFTKRRGYDPLTFLVTLSGRYVDGGEATERFLWDFRRTIGDLFADNYYNYFADLCHKNGLKFSTEPYDGPFECLQVGAKADVVMGEFWYSPGAFLEGVSQSVKLAASVAHTHGIPIVGAESFTAGPDDSGKWMGHPGALKRQGDSTWCLGINRYIFHTYAHQPWLDHAPGMTMGQWGTHFGRFNTWWEQSVPWMKYIARSQYLLQQGRCVGDVLFFAGEASPNGSPFHPELKAKGYDYDTCGTDLIYQLAVKDGRVTTPSGSSYAVLALPDTTWMTPALARKVSELVAAGAKIVGPKPTKSPSLSDNPACDAEVDKIADGVWGTKASESRIISGPVDGILKLIGVQPDCEALGNEAQPAFIHRATDAADIYFVSNQQPFAVTFDCAFRTAGRLPELWNAETGAIEPAPMWRVADGRTVVTLNLDQAGSVFVVFRQKAAAPNDPIVKIVSPGDDAAAKAAPKLEIRKAAYGDFSKPDGKRVDVTAKLQELVKNGHLQASASNSLAGDPAYMVVKELHLEYALDGKVQSAVYQENETILLPDDQQTPQPPRPKLVVEDGKLSLIAAKAGRYSVKTASGAEKTAVIENLPEPAEITGSWELTFPAGRGAPEKATFDQLVSWPECTEKGIKYFSGTATYHKKITIPQSALAANRTLLLDLGKVKEIAEVRLNGQKCGIAWKSPFRVDITKAAKAGDNELEVEVTNLWPNRLIGDEQEPEDVEWNSKNDIILKKWPDWFVKGEPRPVQSRQTFTTWHHWRKDSPLQPSGLLGPVMLRSLEEVPVK